MEPYGKERVLPPLRGLTLLLTSFSLGRMSRAKPSACPRTEEMVLSFVRMDVIPSVKADRKMMQWRLEMRMPTAWERFPSSSLMI
ncbi:hypothetical protein EYF80_029137 [Liparis tanakae]|uniref:Uncharacterized protein n=1 Tax=Liparis tanakae TaxID=230148 RepID=A0A4Z2H765_9TELE|nr:hypothetical protein EYF80_029137 [Liparis tanakae]